MPAIHTPAFRLLFIRRTVLVHLLAPFLLAHVATAQTRLGGFQAQIDGITRVGGVDWSDDGTLHALDASNGEINRYDDRGRLRGSEKIGGGDRLVGASGLALGPGGRVYVSETARHRVLMRHEKTGRTIPIVGLGHRFGEVNTPTGLDAAGERVVVADTGNRRAQIFDINGYQSSPTVLKTLSIDDPFMMPVDAAIHGPTGRVFVVDAGTHRVYRFSGNGDIEMYFGGFGDAPGLMNAPSAIDIKGDRLYIADTRNHRVQVFDTDGEFLYWWGLHTLEPHRGEGRLHYPDAIAVHPTEDLIAVGESFEDRVQIFGPETTESRALQEEDRLVNRGISGHYGRRLGADGDLLALIEPETATVLVFDTSRDLPIEITRLGGYGRGFGRLVSPVGVAIDADAQRVAVADESTGRVSLYTLDRDPDGPVRFSPTMGRFIKAVDLKRSALYQKVGLTWPPHPIDCEFREDGRLDVLDRANCTVVTLGESFDVESKRGGIGYGAIEMLRPYGMQSLGDGRIAVTEPDLRRIRIFGEDELDVATVRIDGAPAARPTGIMRTARGLLLTDAAAHRLIEIDLQGNVLRRSGDGGRGLGPDRYFKPAALDTSGRTLFISDYGNHRLTIREYDDHDAGADEGAEGGIGDFRHAFGPYKFTDPANESVGSDEEETSQ